MNNKNVTLRITVTDKCNFGCVYCSSNMEVFEPSDLSSHAKRMVDVSNNIDTKNSVSDLIRLAKTAVLFGVNRVSLTGGEPLIKKDLPEICEALKEEAGIKRIEVTTNGVLLKKFLQNPKSGYIDMYKVSLDSVNEIKFNTIVQQKAFQQVVEGIDLLKSHNKLVVLNTVVSKENFSEINDIIDFATNREIDISMLDLVCYDDTVDYWKKNFLDFNLVSNYLSEKFHKISSNFTLSPGVAQRLNEHYFKKRTTSAEDYTKHGIEYEYFDTGKIYIRIKNSKQATQRDIICENCKEYCQEGLHSIRVSPGGWITPCQSNNKDYGFAIGKLTDKELKNAFESVLIRFNNAYKLEGFEKFLSSSLINN